MLFFPKIRKICQNFAEFSPNLTKFFRDFSKMQHFSEITNYPPPYPSPIPPPIRNRRSFARFWSRSVCLFLASSSARPAGRSPRRTDDREGSWGRSRSTGTAVGAELASPSFRLGFVTPSRATFQAFSRPICSLTFFNCWLMFGKL